MQIDKFQTLWLEVFNKSDKLVQWNKMLLKLKEAGLLPDANIEKFKEIWLEVHSDMFENHIDEMHQLTDRLIIQKFLFVNDEIEARYRMKIYLEEVFIRWILDAYNDEDIIPAVKFLVDDLKLLPVYFSSLLCQTLWRMIVDKYQKQEPFGAVSLVAEAGFIDYGDFVDFYFKEDNTLPPRYPFINYPELVNCAEMIMKLNALLLEELDRQDNPGKPEPSVIQPTENAAIPGPEVDNTNGKENI